MVESRMRSRIFCNHCSDRVSKSTYYRHRANEATSAFASTEQSRRFETDPANGDAPSSSDSVTDQSFDNSAPETFVGSNLPAGEEGNSKINFD